MVSNILKDGRILVSLWIVVPSHTECITLSIRKYTAYQHWDEWETCYCRNQKH